VAALIPELLAPAGNFEKLKIALAMGADAVYASGEAFGLRNQASNFRPDELKDAIDYTHHAGKKIYITVNIYAHEIHLAPLKIWLKFLDTLQPDGIIVSDPGAILLAQSYCPTIPLHLSTQANTTNHLAVKFYQQLGIQRINLARELTVDEIRSIRCESKMKLEIFVHGAMCMAYSGRCLISAALNARSANQGDCTHPCRWDFTLLESSRPGESFPIEEDDYGSYILNSKDLCLLEHLPAITEIGIDSIKIEGRMKSIHYLTTTVAVYRSALDTLASSPQTFNNQLAEWQSRLNEVDHRPYTSAFFGGTPPHLLQNYSSLDYLRQFKTVAIVRRIYKKTWILLEIKSPFSKTDQLESYTPEGLIHQVQMPQSFSLFGEEIEEFHSNDFVLIEYDKRFAIHSLIRKKLLKQTI